MHDSIRHGFTETRQVLPVGAPDPESQTPGTDPATPPPAGPDPSGDSGTHRPGCCAVYHWAIARGIEIKRSSPLRNCTCSDTPRRADPAAPNPRVYVVDTRTDTVGEVMDHQGPRLQLRPPTGGREWEAEPQATRPATGAELLRAKVRAANADSARGEH